MPVISGGGGGTTSTQVATSGKVLPVAAPTGVTVDTTTYDNPVTGSGKLATVVFPATSGAALAIAVSGDVFPRYLFVSTPTDGVYLGDGTFDLYNGVQPVAFSVQMGGGNNHIATIEGGALTAQVGTADGRGGGMMSLAGSPPRIRFNGFAGGLTGASGAPTIGGEVGDHYIRSDGPPYLYECTVAGADGLATWVTLPQAAPADASFRAGDCALWFDKTNGAAKLNVKGKTADGTVVTASIAMA